MDQLRAQVDRLTDTADRLTRAIYGDPSADGLPQKGMAADLRDLDRLVRTLARSDEHLTDQMAEMLVVVRDQATMYRESLRRLDDHDRRIQAQESGVQALMGKVEENTGLTSQTLASVSSVADMVSTMQDIQAAGRLGARAARALKAAVLWLAPLAKAASAIALALAAAWYALKGGGPPPKP